MEYQALYRKYRPQVFANIVGQDHVTTTLAREVAEGRVAHAYLFAGPRGTGKTTSARILAKALNCQDPPGKGEPCDACESCRAVAAGSSFDVTELDAASHNSVDDIRDIRISVTTVASVGGAKRVFILDEAHMLSKAAGNALLKTLEEPPEHVHFVLATTEPYKLLDTIRSRSQRFDFHPVSVDTLTRHLDGVATAEGFEVRDNALTHVARHAKGSVRDALSLLEQVAALGAGVVEPAGVTRALGLADRDMFMSLAHAIETGDARTALEVVSTLSAGGVDLRRFVGEAIGFLRGVFLAHYAPNLDEVTDETPEVLEDWRAVAGFLEPSQVIRSIDVLSEGLMRLREGREERLMTELSLLKVVRPEVAVDTASFSARLEKMERRVNRLAQDARETRAEPGDTSSRRPVAEAQSTGRAAAPARDVEPPTTQTAPTPDAPFVPARGSDAEAETSPPAAPAPSPEPVAPSSSEAPRPEPAEFSAEELESMWPALVAQVRDVLGLRREALLREARPGRVDGSEAVLYVARHLSFHLSQLQADAEVSKVIAAQAGEMLGGAVTVRFEADPDEGTDGGSETGGPGDDGEDRRQPLPDKDRMRPADRANDDAQALVEDLLGGELIEDHSTG